MKRMWAGTLVGAAALGLAVPAAARDLQSAECGQSVPLDAEFIAGIEPDRFFTAPLGESDVVLVAEGQSGLGLGTFVRRNGRWRAYGLVPLGSIEGVFRSETGSVFAWAAYGQGGISHFVGFHVGPRPGAQFCSRIEMPGELNRGQWRGEYLGFEGFNVDASGTGAVVGSADVVEQEGAEPAHVTYRYSTRNGGRTWAAPVRTPALESPAGNFVRITSGDPAILADLRQAAR